jgi:phytoene desaturase
VRTVRGATDHVVVVGAGLGGLSAAMRLAAAGRQVTLLERGPQPGGRAGVLADGGYRFDTGPTVLTMPHLIEDAFASLGESMADWLTLAPVEPAYRAFFPDGTRLDVLTDVDAMAAEVARVIGPGEAAGYRKYVDFVSTLYRHQMRRFIDANFDSPFALLNTDLARLAAMGSFGRMADKVASYLHDPRMQRVMSFQSMYAGLSPFDALAVYCVISYMDSVAGVFAPVGGMHAVPEAMASACVKHGVEIRYETDVVRVMRSGDTARAVVTAEGEWISGDAFVLNPDLPVAMRDLLGVDPWTIRRLRYSPSCYLMLAGSSQSYRQIAHHNIHFGRAWRTVFDELIHHGTLMSDPSFLVSNPTRTDPSLAPEGREAYYVLFPTPNMDAGIDWTTTGPRYRDVVLSTLEARGYRGFADAVEVSHERTPLDWARSGLERGTPFAASHTFGQSGPFRPRNIWGRNVVFAGSGTTPGVGVPMVLISGRLAAERITGAGS